MNENKIMFMINIGKTLRTIVLSAVLAAATIPVAGQDLLARMVPVDKKAKQLDTLALQSVRVRENLDMPSDWLYKDWDNRYAHHLGR